LIRMKTRALRLGAPGVSGAGDEVAGCHQRGEDSRMTRRAMERALALVCLGLVVAGCSTVPGTERRQLMVVTSAQEMQLGQASFTQLKQETPISTNAVARAMVERVGQRIAAVAPLPNAEWEFVLFESPEANAFCLPGGKVGVYTGILQVTKTEAGLATVIGHEVAHAVARHGAERMSEALAMQGVGALLSVGLDQTELDPAWKQAATTAYGVGATVGRELPHSRDQESEADYLGLLYMARAGYDPAEAVEFWKRFKAYNEARGGGSTLWFLRTHPLDDKRIQDLNSHLPEAKREYRGP